MCRDCGESFEPSFDRQKYCLDCWPMDKGRSSSSSAGGKTQPDLALLHNSTVDRLGGPTWRSTRAPDKNCAMCEGTGWMTVERGAVDSVAKCRCRGAA